MIILLTNLPGTSGKLIARVFRISDENGLEGAAVKAAKQKKPCQSKSSLAVEGEKPPFVQRIVVTSMKILCRQ
jgi:hypothetical protein